MAKAESIIIIMQTVKDCTSERERERVPFSLVCIRAYESLCSLCCRQRNRFHFFVLSFFPSRVLLFLVPQCHVTRWKTHKTTRFGDSRLETSTASCRSSRSSFLLMPTPGDDDEAGLAGRTSTTINDPRYRLTSNYRANDESPFRRTAVG